MSQSASNPTHLRTLRLRVKDKHAVELARQARAVNYVWNYIHELSERSIRERGVFLSAFDLHRYTTGARAAVYAAHWAGCRSIPVTPAGVTGRCISTEPLTVSGIATDWQPLPFARDLSVRIVGAGGISTSS